MSETRIRPRLEFELQPAPRLEQLPVVVTPLPSKGIGTVALLGGGGAILALGLTALAVGNFITAQFERAASLGWLTTAIAVAGFGLIAAAIWRELRGLFALRAVDRLRADLADPVRAHAAARVWVEGLDEGAALLPALRATEGHDATLALLRAGPVATLRARADILGRNAALQIFAVTAAIPSPALDGLLVAWRGIRLVREVAALHGMRPGLLGTLALLRRTALSAAGVAATDLAANTLAYAVVSNPLLAHVAGDVAGAGVAARRMVVLARAAALACSPI